MTARPRPSYVVLCLALLNAGCGGDGQPAAVDTTRDSAGVTIVRNVNIDAPPRWVPDTEPLLTIGAREEAGFGQIAGLAWLPDGTIGVADALSRTIRFFGAEGVEIATAGGRGEGPGEFEAIAGTSLFGTDSVAVWDARLMRYTVVAPDGGFGSVVRLQPTGERARPIPLAFLADGRMIAESDAREMPSLDYYRARIDVLAYDSHGEVAQELISVPGVEMWDWVWEAGTTPSMVPFGRTTHLRVQRKALYVAANDGYQIDRYDLEGKLVLRIRLDRETAPLSRALIDAYKAAERAKATSSVASKGPGELFGRMADAAPYPDRLPHYEGLLIDHEDRVWVRDFRAERDEPTRFTVFAPEGALLGFARFAAEFTPAEIRGHQVLGIWRDELDVEHVRLYELIAS